MPSLTALDNVLLAGRYAGRTGPETRRRARELLARFGVLERQDHYPPQLSGGEQQRVAFCRAVLNDPPLLLADEPTGNLDDANGRVILEALRARARERGRGGGRQSSRRRRRDGGRRLSHAAGATRGRVGPGRRKSMKRALAALA